MQFLRIRVVFLIGQIRIQAIFRQFFVGCNQTQAALVQLPAQIFHRFVIEFADKGNDAFRVRRIAPVEAAGNLGAQCPQNALRRLLFRAGKHLFGERYVGNGLHAVLLQRFDVRRVRLCQQFSRQRAPVARPAL